MTKYLSKRSEILRDSFVRTRLIVVVIGMLLWWPLAGLPVWRYVYGFTGDLTPATWLLFFVWLGFPSVFRHWIHAEMSLRHRLALFAGLVLFYTLALGSWSLDPYAYGYQPWALFGVLAAWAIWRGRNMPGLLLLLSLDLTVYGLHGLASSNLWDYLVDPVLMIVLGISLIRGVMSRRFKSTR